MSRSFLGSSNQYLEGTPPPVGVAPLTISAHFNVPSGVTSSRYILALNNTVTNLNYFALLSSAGDLYALTRSGSLGFAITSTSHTFDDWHHGCAVFNSSNSRSVYLDGGSKGTDTTNITPVGVDSLTVGAILYSSQFYFNGKIAEVGIWDVALTDEEVYILSLGYSPLLVRPQNLVFYLPLVRDNDNDLVGGLNLTPFNGPTVSGHPRVLYPRGPQNSYISSIAPIIPAGEVNATILAKTPHLVFSEKYPSIGIVPKTPKIEIST